VWVPCSESRSLLGFSTNFRERRDAIHLNADAVPVLLNNVFGKVSEADVSLKPDLQDQRINTQQGLDLMYLLKTCSWSINFFDELLDWDQNWLTLKLNWMIPLIVFHQQLSQIFQHMIQWVNEDQSASFSTNQ